MPIIYAYDYELSGVTEKTIVKGDLQRLDYNYEKALEFYHMALKSLKDKENRLELYKKIAICYWFICDYQKSLQFFEKAVQLAKGPKRSLLYRAIAACYIDIGDYDSAILMIDEGKYNARERLLRNVMGLMEIFYLLEKDRIITAQKKVRRIAKLIDKEKNIGTYAEFLVSSAAVEATTGHLMSAEQKVEEALGIFQDLGMIQGVANSYHMLGQYNRKLKRFKKAKTYFERAIESYLEIRLPLGEIKSYLELGALYYEFGQYELAEEYLLKCHRFDNVREFNLVRMEAFYYMGLVKYNLEEYAASIENLEKSLSLAKLKDLKGWKIRLQLQMAEIFLLGSGDLQRFLAMRRAYWTLFDEDTSVIFRVRDKYLLSHYYYSTDKVNCMIKVLKKYAMPMVKKHAKVLEPRYKMMIHIMFALAYSKKTWIKWGQKYLDHALRIARQAGDPIFLALIHYYSGLFYSEKKDKREAREFLNKALQAMEELNVPRLQRNIKRALDRLI